MNKWSAKKRISKKIWCDSWNKKLAFPKYYIDSVTKISHSL